MDRKKFLLSGTLAAFSLTALGRVLKNPEGQFAGDCTTTSDILGPFYRPGAPNRNDLTWEGLPGNRIQVEGQVFGQDCKTPVPGALVEFWHCDTRGEYDNTTDEFKHRGLQYADENGAWKFLSILPGKYLNGDLYRPSHIHFRVTASGYKELVSQIYFSGDPHIEKDPWAGHPRAAQRILPLVPEDVNGNISIRFDIYLQKK